MNWQIIRHCLWTVLWACVQWTGMQAATVVEVGAFVKASALPVLSAEPACGLSGDSVETARDTLRTESETDARTEKTTAALAADSITAPVDTAKLSQVTDSLTAKAGKVKLPKPRFIPNPNRALWLSLVLPGAGQIYNRKYWKLPFIYGGFLGCAYALMWNQQMYKDYSQAYLDIMDDNPATNSFLEMLPPRYDITGREEQFKRVFKRKKDFYRRYRDLSAFCFIGVYLLSVVDAYVDAQLSVFDISPDLSMSVEPAVMGNPSMLGPNRSTAYGVGCSLHF